MAEIIPSGIRLKNLIQNRHAEILSREKGNDKFIHLYNIGTYWVAFERSAYGLNNIFSKSEIALFKMTDSPNYIIMASIVSDEAVLYFHKHIVYCEEPDYKVIFFHHFQ